MQTYGYTNHTKDTSLPSYFTLLLPGWLKLLTPTCTVEIQCNSKLRHIPSQPHFWRCWQWEIGHRYGSIYITGTLRLSTRTSAMPMPAAKLPSAHCAFIWKTPRLRGLSITAYAGTQRQVIAGPERPINLTLIYCFHDLLPTFRLRNVMGWVSKNSYQNSICWKKSHFAFICTTLHNVHIFGGLISLSPHDHCTEFHYLHFTDEECD